MNLKKKLLASTATIAVGAMATIGGTFAYFGDDVSASSKFTNGTLDLQPEAPTLEHFTITNWKPGDILDATEANKEPAMTLNSQGTLPMNVFMNVDVVDPATGPNKTKSETEVMELKFGGQDIKGLFDTDKNGTLTLAELEAEANGDTTLNGHLHAGVGKYIGFLKGKNATDWQNIKSLTYKLKFVDDGTNQEDLEGEATQINFQFTGLQYEGKTLDKTNLSNGSGGASGGGNFERKDDVTNDADSVNREN